jgi:hypothetical protein
VLFACEVGPPIEFCTMAKTSSNPRTGWAEVFVRDAGPEVSRRNLAPTGQIVRNEIDARFSKGANNRESQQGLIEKRCWAR